MSSSPLPSWEPDFRLARSGDPDALDRLFGTAGFRLRSLARRRLPAALRSKASPEDLAQQAVLKAFCAFARFAGATEQQWRTWLRAILTRAVQDLVRDYHRPTRDVAKEVPLKPEGAGARQDIASPEVTPDEQARLSEGEALLRKVVEELPEALRQVFRLRHADGLSYAEIGWHLGLAENAVRKRHALAPGELKQKSVEGW